MVKELIKDSSTNEIVTYQVSRKITMELATATETLLLKKIKISVELKSTNSL